MGLKLKVLAAILAQSFSAGPDPGYNPVDVFPRFLQLNDGATETGGSFGWDYPISGGGWCSQCDTVFPDDDDWTFEWTVPETVLLVGLNPSPDQDTSANFEYRIGIFANPTATPTITQGGDGKTNSEFNPTCAAGDKLRFRKTGRQITAEVYTAVHPVWEIFHMFEFEPSGDLWPQGLTFFGDATFTPRGTLGQMQDILPYGQYAFTSNGNSLTVRDPGVSWSIGKSEDDGGIPVGPKGDLITRLRTMAPFLGSGSLFANVGVDGQTTEDMVGRRAELSAAFVDGRTNWTFNWELANGIFTQGHTASAEVALMKELLDNANEDNAWAGHVVISPIPRHAAYTEPNLTNLNTINRAAGTLIRDDPAAYSATAYVDLCATGEPWEFPDGYGADQYDPAYWYDGSPNEIHQSPFGRDTTAVAVAAKFTDLLV